MYAVPPIAAPVWSGAARGQVADRLCGAGARIDLHDRVDLGGAGAAAEEVGQLADRDGRGVVHHTRQVPDPARARARHRDDVVARRVGGGKAAEQHGASAERRGCGVLHRGVERARVDRNEPADGKRARGLVLPRGRRRARRGHAVRRRRGVGAAAPGGRNRGGGEHEQCGPGPHSGKHHISTMNGA